LNNTYKELFYVCCILSDQKLTFEQLKAHLWSAANILRGSIDANEFRQPIMSLLFLKRLNDQFEEEAEKVEKKTGNKKIAWEDKDEHVFFVPKTARWNIISSKIENLGEVIDKVCEIIEKENPKLEGVLTNTIYNDKKRFPDDKLLDLVVHFNKHRLRNSDLEREDVFGQAYEYLLEQFADSAGKKAGEFFTPREVVRLLVQLVEPDKKMKICDPTCGSGGMLIESREYVKRKGIDPRNISLYGQESNYGNFGMCKMNMILHGVLDFQIEHGDTLKNPMLVEGGKLIKFDRIIANFPFSMIWTNANATNDPHGRFNLGIAPKNYADFAYIQHMYSTLNEKGRAAIISSQGVLFRGGQEEQIRKKMIEADVIEGIIALPSNLFYGTGIPACVFLLNKAKPKERKNKVILIYAAKDFLDAGKRDLLRPQDIKKIIDAFTTYCDIEKYCHIADLEEIKENGYNLNVPRYVDISEPEERVDIQKIIDEIKKLEKERKSIEVQVHSSLKELDFRV
jgi:type I restriction enzyme M protein